eukprot:CAMPEP_0117512542 /NCGR_PEP_ID=MMETSP0784-20121206/29084_1 /TAXON_ID=39447 /ORGANISM="" /LENGTH=455 /DNA_ID=CAMNT_0005308263 /DNA_START=1 /DNA_END=1365 /DNA_ORIENTATION=+
MANGPSPADVLHCVDGEQLQPRGVSIPPWMQDKVADCLGCPAACELLGSASFRWREVLRQGDFTHDAYRCRRSRRRVSLMLPDGVATPTCGLSPASFSEIWRRWNRELTVCASDSLGSATDSALHGPVRCPHPGCNHEEPTAALAAEHSALCREGGSGFRYADPKDISAALRRRAMCQKVEVIVDADFGGSRSSSPISCVCELDADTPSLLLRGQDMRRVSTRFHLEKCRGVQRGWQLDGQARRALERGAFPRTVDFVVLCGRYDNTYDFHTSRLSGWTFCPGSCNRVLSDDAWDRTLVVRWRAVPDSKKQRDGRLLLERHSQGVYDRVYVYALGVMEDSGASSLDAQFPATSDEWRVALRERLRAAGNAVSRARALEVEQLLEAPCSAMRKEDIALEYSDCDTDFIFISFDAQLHAEHFCRRLEAALRNSGHGDVCGSESEIGPVLEPSSSVFV